MSSSTRGKSIGIYASAFKENCYVVITILIFPDSCRFSCHTADTVIWNHLSINKVDIYAIPDQSHFLLRSSITDWINCVIVWGAGIILPCSLHSGNHSKHTSCPIDCRLIIFLPELHENWVVLITEGTTWDKKLFLLVPMSFLYWTFQQLCDIDKLRFSVLIKP